jgi:hypothetical protein
MELQAKLNARELQLREKEQRLNQAREDKLMKKLLIDEMKQQKVYKSKLHKDRTPTKAILRELARREREKVKRWREKDKKQLFEHVKIRYLQYRKLKVNLVRVDTLKKERRQFLALQSQSSRKRSAKRNSKQLQSLCLP